ncbi:MAG: glycoside hydrolase [Marmoricola sp.]|nr:glycoside hydrolase [Marmoricola sp.]
MYTTTRRTFTRASTIVGAVLLAATVFSIAAPTADATGAPAATRTSTTVVHKPKPSFDARVMSTVASRRGSPYVYGASGPHRFDCSGLTMWTFRRLGHRLPHSAAAQYGRTRHIRASQRRRGDLVFFHDSSGIYHVGIYAGHNQIWHAPYPGQRVRKERLWTSAVYYGRIRG